MYKNKHINDVVPFYENCIVCCKEIKLYSFGECNHAVCFECSTRMRVLCQENYCPVCRRTLDKIIITKRVRPFEEFPSLKVFLCEKKHGIYFTNEAVQQAYRELLQHKCHLCKERRPDRNLPVLRDHLRREHDLFYCDICLRHLKLFSQERKTYTRKQLAIHRRQGDEDDTSHKGHPLCEFCDERYLDSDELYRHLRREHFFCHFCDADGLYKYYSDYNVLRDHFRDEHYLCEEDSCIEEKFTSVFRSEIDLKAHKAKEHGKGRNKLQSRQARTLELEFTFTRNQDGNRRGDGRSGRSDRFSGTAHADHGQANRNNTGRPGRYNRGRQYDYNQQYNNDRQSEANLNLALALSSSEAEAHKAQQQTPDAGDSSSENFPFLSHSGQNVPPPVPPQDPGLASKKKAAVETIAKRLAGINRFNVADDNCSDFPALGSSSSSTSNTGLASVADWIKNKKPSERKNKPMPSLQRKLSEEFPTLGAAHRKTHMNPQPKTAKSLLGGAPAEPTKSPQPSKPAGNIMVTRKPPNPKLGLQHRQNSLEMRLDSPDDFPGLGATSPKSSHSVTVNVKRKTLQSPNRTRSLDSNDFPVLGKNSSGDSHSSNESLSTISVKTKLRPQNETIEERKSSNGSLVRKNRPPAFTLRTSVSQENLNSSFDSGTPDVQSEDDFPNLPQNRPRFARSISVQLSPTSENFPGLSSITITTPPPSSVQEPPPGFGPRAPPGLCSASSSVPFENTTVTITANVNSTPTMIMTNGTNTVVNCNPPDYIQPPNYKQRNLQLIFSIRESLGFDEEKFAEFKSQSGQFRQGIITAKEYYENCQQLFGNSNFNNIFPELLTLLPDINRQQELLRAHRTLVKHQTSQSNAWMPNDFSVCFSCQQVLKSSDLKAHQSYHSFEEDFPALGI